MKHPLAGIICQSLNDRVAHFFNQSCSRLLRYLRATTQHGCRLDKREQYKRKQNDKSQLFRLLLVRFVTRSGRPFLRGFARNTFAHWHLTNPLVTFRRHFHLDPKINLSPQKKTPRRCYRRIFTASLGLPSCFPATKKDEIFFISFREYENFSPCPFFFLRTRISWKEEMPGLGDPRWSSKKFDGEQLVHSCSLDELIAASWICLIRRAVFLSKLFFSLPYLFREKFR